MSELRVDENWVGSSAPEVRLWVRGRLVKCVSFLERGMLSVMVKRKES